MDVREIGEQIGNLQNPQSIVI